MKAFIYDMDGVIVDSEIIHMKAETILLARYGIETDEALLMPYRGTSDATMFEDIKDKYDASYDVAGIVAEKDVLMRHLLQTEALIAIDGALDLIKATNALRARGIRTAIASSSPYETINHVTETFGIAGKFDVIVSGAELPMSKPDPTIYLQTAELLGVAPADCLVLEDAAVGAQAAVRAGMTCIGFCSPHSGVQDFSGCARIVHNLSEIDLNSYFGE
ncbi:HAD family phosphatase [Selenomonas sp. oral taxon 138]|uniref:HAD family hydrolase n=1 Tax=Selenomonas sp. oral taxon 138 TaxID=712532 RepID=UPI0002A466C4|nr:HAD family phosphatase [Selenomonas sp. oral taxon 138]EKX98563.1 HAD hydrolase, family IA, variant 3 [Selenomonas sp. oral taxon 138 str. F0429]